MRSTIKQWPRRPMGASASGFVHHIRLIPKQRVFVAITRGRPMSQQMIPVFDGHNDTILSLRETGRSFFERSETGHIDFPRAKAGGLAGGFFAVWVPSPNYEHGTDIAATGSTEAAQGSALTSLGG